MASSRTAFTHDGRDFVVLETPLASFSELTLAEQRVALLVTRGQTDQQIPDELGRSHRTVTTHLSSIYRKLKIKNRFELTALRFKTPNDGDGDGDGDGGGDGRAS